MYACSVCHDSYCPGCERAEVAEEDLCSYCKEYKWDEGFAPYCSLGCKQRGVEQAWEIFRGIEGGRAAHLILGSLAPVRRAVA